MTIMRRDETRRDLTECGCYLFPSGISSIICFHTVKLSEWRHIGAKVVWRQLTRMYDSQLVRSGVCQLPWLTAGCAPWDSRG